MFEGENVVWGEFEDFYICFKKKEGGGGGSYMIFVMWFKIIFKMVVFIGFLFVLCL